MMRQVRFTSALPQERTSDQLRPESHGRRANGAIAHFRSSNPLGPLKTGWRIPTCHCGADPAPERISLKHLLTTSAAALLACAVSGCAVPIIGGLTLGEWSSGASLISSGLTGKSLSEQGLDLATGKDCRVVEAALRDDRQFCEVRGSDATKSDFKGLIGS